MIELESIRRRAGLMLIALVWLCVPLNIASSLYLDAPWMVIGGASAAIAVVAGAIAVLTGVLSRRIVFRQLSLLL